MAVAFFILAAAAAPPPAKGADILVTSTAGGSTTIDGNCTLWEAIAAAKGNSAVDACAAGEAGVPDVVNVPAGTFTWDSSMAILGGAGGPLVVRGAPGAVETLPTIVQVDPTSPLRFLRLVEGADATLENLHIRGGDVTGDPTNENGGTILVDQVAAVSLTLSNVEISTSRARLGGAIFFSTQGGGSGPRRLKIERSDFRHNYADFGSQPGSPRGGAIYVETHEATQVTIVASRFIGNHARTVTIGWSAYGGALFGDFRDQSSLELRSSEFWANEAESATSGEGQAWNGGATIVATDNSTIKLADLEFWWNNLYGQRPPEAATSLAIASAASAAVVFDGVKLLRGSLYDTFGLVYQHLSSVPARLSNVVLFSTTTREAKIEAFSSQVVMTNWSTASEFSSALLVECHPGSDIQVLNTLIQGPWTNDGCSPFDSSTLVGSDLHFVDPFNGDLRLRADSPAIDMGAGEFVGSLPLDAGHATRIVGGQVDIGAFEFGALFTDGFESGDTGSWFSMTSWQDGVTRPPARGSSGSGSSASLPAPL